jgi:5'-3' exonuclease
MNFILIDGSYYIFYRYHALRIWWGLAKKEDETDDYCNNPRFVEKFRETFTNKMEELSKKLKLDNCIMIVGKDCPRNEIWRNKYIDNYKAGRGKGDPNVKKLFEIAYSENLFIKSGAKFILSYPELEADDCLAITAKHIIKTKPDAKIWVITSDMDYLQLAGERLHIIDLKFKDLTTSKNSFKDARKDLFCKIISGDKSDNIPAVLPRCGMKTASKLYEDSELFEHRMNTTEGSRERYERNKLIIDFDRIPPELIKDFKLTNITKLET